MAGYDAVAFDLDGTLVDSAPGILWALAQAAADVLPGVDVHDVRIGPPLPTMLGTALPEASEAELARVLARFRELYDHEGGWRRLTLMPDIEASLDALRPLPLHVVTNKRLAPSQLILGEPAFAGRFDSVMSLDSPPGFATKADVLAELLRVQRLDPARVPYVGDSPEDESAAQAVGMPFVAVAWGYGFAEGHGPADRLATLTDLTGLAAVVNDRKTA